MKLPARHDNPRLRPEARWADANKTYGHSNPNRAREVADRILSYGISSILDLGCGDMKLGELMRQAGVGYVPADLVARSPDCLVVNLNEGEIPCVDAQCVVMVGVLEFLNDPARVLNDISGKYQNLLLTLSPLQTIYEQIWHGKPHRIVCDHAVAYSLNAFKKLFVEYFVVEDIDVISTGQYVIFGRSRALSRRPADNATAEKTKRENEQLGIGDNSIDFNLLAKGFEEHIFKSVPFHSMFLKTTALLASAVAKPGTVCVDIGCSTGRLARLIRRHVKETVPVEIIAIDKSHDMIAEARRRDPSPLTKYVAEDVMTYEFPASMIFASCLFTLQFLEPGERHAILEKMYRSLDWRGCAVVAEKVVEPDGKKQMTNHYLLNAFKHSMGFTDDEVLSKERAVRSTLRPFTREENTRLFEQAGFKRVHVVASCFGWDLYLLEKT